MSDSFTLNDQSPAEKDRAQRVESIIASAERLYRLETARPHWPTEGSDLSFLLPKHDRAYSWETWQLYFIDCAIWPEFYETGTVRPLSKLLHGSMQLPKVYLKAAHHRLFGEKTDCPTLTGITTVAAALFNPAFATHGQGYTRCTWSEIVRKANVLHEQELNAQREMEDLIKNWG
ncbi:hypothetical protein SynMEDNS5_01562 [Synechococcus sp. MEDNS5]|uniref:hypothetical protein n=1 Tax=Synechococcus sp. MEDNS5 TaxID=1442554 RepID=UPI0016467A47|nr:hypothetical protein [Synechococcus sp. MEDNS5]QNJ06281.1 hypothetical protein SynMEDNS5_01562 [Synechococcus sp. MEDNS5]